MEPERQLKCVSIYTDGSCKGNPGPGGYGSVLISSGIRKEISGGYRLTTNNRMELQALLQALLELNEPCKLEVYTDSQYLLGGFQKNWVRSWKRNGWLTSAKEPVLNRDLWMKLDELLSSHSVNYHWVRGHGSNVENNRCDELAVRAARGRTLQEDLGYEVAGRPASRPSALQEPRPKRAQKRPDTWDDDLFSAASKATGEPVNWDF